MSEFSHLIIGGATRAGTTSLFIYLSDHPEVCGASIKETRFFLDEDYPLQAKFRYRQGMNKYKEYFKHCKGEPIRLEATPDYLYSTGTPRRIREALPEAKLLFILRDPIERLVSWYKFARQLCHLSPKVSFDEYVRLQLQREGDSGPVDQHMLALEQGRYSIYLKTYFKTFPNDAIRIYSYEAFQSETLDLMMKISRFVGIDSTFYKDYDFKVFNPAYPLRSARFYGVYHRFSQGLRHSVHDKPRLRAVLRTIRRRFEPFLLRPFLHLDEKTVISEPIKALLDEYYRDEYDALAKLF